MLRSLFVPRLRLVTPLFVKLYADPGHRLEPAAIRGDEHEF